MSVAGAESSPRDWLFRLTGKFGVHQANWRAALARDAAICVLLKAGEDLEEGLPNIEANTPAIPKPGFPQSMWV